MAALHLSRRRPSHAVFELDLWHEAIRATCTSNQNSPWLKLPLMPFVIYNHVLFSCKVVFIFTKCDQKTTVTDWGQTQYHWRNLIY